MERQQSISIRLTIAFTIVGLAAALWANSAGEPRPENSPQGLSSARGKWSSAPSAGPDNGGLDHARSPGHAHPHPHNEIGCCASAASTLFESGSPDRLVPLSLERSPRAAAVGLEFASGQVLFKVASDAPDRVLEQVGARFAGARSLGGLGLYVLDAGARADIALVVSGLESIPGIAYAEPNFVARPSDDDHATGPHHDCAGDGLGHANCANFDSIGLAAARARCERGCAILVAVLDSGLDRAHEDLAGTTAPFAIDLVNEDSEPEDILGHGTAIAGLIGAKAGNGCGASGVCPTAVLLGIKVADSRGVATFANLVRGILLATERGARVINMSLGSRADSAALREAVRHAHESGVVLVAPTGNDNTNLEMVPARYPEVLAVASTAADGNLAITTNVGFHTDVAAPGEHLVTTAPGNLYSSVCGTSCASAVTAGAAALVLSANPELTPSQVRAILVRTARPIPAVDEQLGIFDFGRLDLESALAQSASSYEDAGIVRVRTLPAHPKAGQPVRIEALVANLGNRALPALEVGLEGAPNAPAALTGPLAVGKRQWVSLQYTAKATALPGAALSARILSPGAADAISGNNARPVEIELATRSVLDLAIAGVDFEDRSFDLAAIRFAVTVENRGNVEARGVSLATSIHGRRDYDRQSADLGRLAPGESATTSFMWTLPDRAIPEKLALDIAISSALPDETPADTSATFAFHLSTPDAEKARLQYQQGEDIDIIADAPFRVEADRPYVPLMIFVPDNGGRGFERYLELEEIEIQSLAGASGPGRTIYRDTHGAPPTVFPTGAEIVDEDGVVLKDAGGAPGRDFFKDERITERGRHNILRLPLAALGVTGQLTSTAERFVEVKVRWKFHRKLFFFFSWVKRGTHRAVLRVSVSPFALPRVPGGGHYYDSHFHTIAEWFHGDPFRIFAPKKAYGGPIQMIKESAYAIGLIPSPEAIRDKIVTTDHNCFFWNQDNPGAPEDDPDQRPPFGPTSAANSLREDGSLKTEWERYQDLFGAGAGEEISFHQNQALGLLPMGAHMLSHRAAHVDGAWHGGSEFAKKIGEGGPVYLEDVLESIAKGDRAENRHGFTYAAHPFSGQGWSDENLDLALGLSEKNRHDRFVHTEGSGFVFKGLQLMNGRGSRHLPSSAINFDNMNPWANPVWQKGSESWDTTTQDTIAAWHDYIATGLAWSFAGKKDQRFVRKVFGEAGTDAHGDFNFSTGRAATLVRFSMTYAIDSTAWGMVRTYAIPDGKTGATPGERLLAAMADGNSVMTDGPLVVFDVDAEGRFDSDTLAWHDADVRYENADGRMGGEGAFDGGRTMLVAKGRPDAVFRYQLANTPEFGSAAGRIGHVKIYKDEAGRPNPMESYETTSFYVLTKEHRRIKSVGSLEPTRPGEWLYERMNPDQEGSISAPAAFTLGAFTGPDPDGYRSPPPDEYRCYTNPVYAIPYQMGFEVKQSAGGHIPPGGLEVTLAFPLSMMEEDPELAIKILDQKGNTTDGSTNPVSRFSVRWGAASGIAGSRMVAVNLDPIPLTGPGYPTPAKISYCVYTAKPIRDMHGNALNRVAAKFTGDQGGNGPAVANDAPPPAGSGPSPTAPAPTPPSASPATASSASPVSSSASAAAPKTDPKATAKDKKSKMLGVEGCFIATASYDERFAPHVVANAAGSYRLSGTRKRDLDALREFRDEVLLETNPGSAFVAAYYEHGPGAARWLSENDWAKAPVRVALLPAVTASRIAVGRGAAEALLVALLAGLWLFHRRVGRLRLE